MAQEGKLTQKQELFVKEYVKDFNATRAAKAAGYSEKTATAAGTENLRKPNVASRIKDIVDSKHEKLDKDIEDIIELLRNAAYMDISDYVNLTLEEEGEDSMQPMAHNRYKVTITGFRKLKKWQRRLITEASVDRHGCVKLKFFSKEKAIELLGKYHQIWADGVVLQDKREVKATHDNAQEVAGTIGNDFGV